MGKKLTTKEFIAKAEILHHGKYDYSQTLYIDSRSDVKIICPKHDAFTQRASSHLAGNGCPECAKEWTDEHRENLRSSSRRSRGMTTDEWVRRAKEVHGDKYDYSEVVYVNQRTDVTIICPVHGKFTQKADSHIRGCGCKKCGDESENRIGKHSWSDAQKAKTAETCRIRYGAPRFLDSKVGREKIKVVRSDPEYRKRVSRIISSDDVQARTKATCVMRYGEESATRTKEVQGRIYATKKKNHTVNSSKSEMKMYTMLCNVFGYDNVIHQYKAGDRYPFVCDFYIVSLDLFIELNAHWSHGHRWYIGDELDLSIVAEWTEKGQRYGTGYFEAAIETWTIRDVRKRETALANNLNYLVFWKNDLSDFTEWLESDHHVLNNIT